MKRKLLAGLLIFTMLFSLVPTVAMAEDTGETYTLKLIYDYTNTAGTHVGEGIQDKVITDIAPGTVVDLSDHWPNTLTTNANGETYYFRGFKVDNSTGGNVYEEWEVSENVTLYASWVVDRQYVVSFDTKGGVITPKKTFDSGGADIGSFNKSHFPTRSGYRFSGWSLADDGTADDSFSTFLPFENCTLYAVWEEILPIQVGQVELADGEYTTDGESTTTTKPESGGYAYFKDGVLTLNNFTYSGGSAHSTPNVIGSDLAAIFCEHDLTIKVEGRNSITRVVTDADTEEDKTLRGIWNDGDLKIVGDSRDDILKVAVSGHNGALANAVESINESIFIDNCTLEAESVTGGYALIGYKAITITKAKVVASTGTADDRRSTFGIYTMTLKVADSDVIGIAEDNAGGVASGIHMAGNNAKLIFGSGSIIGRTSDVSDESYAIYVNKGDVTLPAKYWMRTSASGEYVNGTWDGANVGSYMELTTTEQHIHDWEINWTYNDKNHWYKCLNGGCSEIKDKADHKGGTATCTAQAVCDVCGAAYGLVAAHDYSVQQYNSRNHWNKCATCDETTVKEDHYYGNNNICDICGYERVAGGGGFTGDYNYPVIIADTDDAVVKASENYAIEGETVTITVDPNSGKQVDEVIVTDEDGDVISVTKTGDNKYSFTMPAGKVTVSVTTEDMDYDTKIVLQIGNKNVVVDNRTIVNDVAPTLVGDRTLVPLRVIIEALGGSVDWDEATRTVTIEIDGKVLTLIIDEEIPGFGQGAIIIDNRTYVPIRYIAEYVDAHVDWIAESQQVVILK